MPGTTGAINGSHLLVYCAGTAIAYSTSCTLNSSMSPIDVTSKDSAHKKGILPGLTEWSLDAEGIVALDSSANAPYLYGLMTGQTKVMLKFSTATSSDDYWHGYGYITNLTITAPMEDKVTFSASFAGDSTLTCSVKT